MSFLYVFKKNKYILLHQHFCTSMHTEALNCPSYIYKTFGILPSVVLIPSSEQIIAFQFPNEHQFSYGKLIIL